jgi:hypothetical protein
MAWPLNHYLRREAGLGGRVRELAILTTARELRRETFCPAGVWAQVRGILEATTT